MFIIFEYFYIWSKNVSFYFEMNIIFRESLTLILRLDQVCLNNRPAQ